MSSARLDTSRHTIDTDFKRSLLRSIALFRDVDPQTMADLLPQCGRIDIKAGDVLLSPDRENRCVYVVLSGELSVHLGARDAPKLADLPPGACAGEMSLIENKDPSAFVVATEDSHLMVLSHGLLWQMVERSHDFAKNLLIVLSERVRSDNEFIANSLGVLQQAERNAVTDALTGLGNRHWMQDMFERELRRSQRNGNALCLMMVDVDNFKRFNDKLGHIAGDRILGFVADVLREHLRPTDLISRFGGDEFAVLLPDATLGDAAETAERLRQHLEQRPDSALTDPITISVGVTSACADDDLDRFLHRADGAMYQAKDQGRNRVCVREPDA